MCVKKHSDSTYFQHEADESYGSFSQNLIVKLTMGDNCCVGDVTNTNRKVRSLIDRQPTVKQKLPTVLREFLV